MFITRRIAIAGIASIAFSSVVTIAQPRGSVRGDSVAIERGHEQNTGLSDSRGSSGLAQKKSDDRPIGTWRGESSCVVKASCPLPNGNAVHLTLKGLTIIEGNMTLADGTLWRTISLRIVIADGRDKRV